MKKIVLIACLVFLPAMYLSAQTGVVTGAFISFEQLSHDLGEVKMDSTVSYNFVFTNTGKEPLLLSEPRSSCGCTVPSYPVDPIMPGQKNSIKITFKADKTGPFTKMVNVLSNAENDPVVIVIKGTVI